MGCCFSKDKLEEKSSYEKVDYSDDESKKNYDSIVKMAVSQDFVGLQKNIDPKDCGNKDKKIEISQAMFVNENSNRIHDDYEIEKKVIGTGGYGYVKFGVHKQSQQRRAIKFIKITNEIDKDELIKEIEILKSLDHPNVMRIYEYYQDSKFFYIVSEICSGGEVFDKILKHLEKDEFFSEKEAASVMRQLLSAISFCHSKKIIHRDLKPDNLLYFNKEEDSPIKLIDFGISALTQNNERLTKFTGTPYYMAPEVLKLNYSYACDIWSCGVIMYILLSGDPPFNGKNNAEIFMKIKAGEFSFKKPSWRRVSEEAKDLITKMLVTQQEERITASECLKHKWFTNELPQNTLSKKQKKKAKKTLKNLQSFHSSSKLQHAFWKYLSSYMISKEEEQELLNVFQAIDQDGCGQLSLKELKEGYNKVLKLSLTEEELEHLFQEIDVDKSGKISYQQFLMAAVDKNIFFESKKLDDLFDLIDEDKCGKIMIQELESFFGGSVCQHQLKDMLKGVDLEKSQEISLKEFKKMMNNMQCHTI